jgi:hypothetical protein
VALLLLPPCREDEDPANAATSGKLLQASSPPIPFDYGCVSVMTTARSLHDHCTITARSLHDHCTITARSLPAGPVQLEVHKLAVFHRWDWLWNLGRMTQGEPGSETSERHRAPAIADVVVPVKYKDGFVLFLSLFIFGGVAYFSFPVFLIYITESVLLLVAVEHIRRSWKDPGFVFDDTAVRIPPIELSPFGLRVLHADIREISVNHRYTINLTTTTRELARGSDYHTEWDREVVERELSERTARALRETHPEVALQVLRALSSNHPELAPLHERVGDLKEALRVYELQGDTENASRVRALVSKA